MINTTEKEFYTKNEPETFKPTLFRDGLEVIEEEVPKELGACTNCEHYKLTKSTYSSDVEACRHPENTHYTYDHEGKHANIIWQPADKNKTLECEFFEKRKTTMQKVKIKLGLL